MSLSVKVVQPAGILDSTQVNSFRQAVSDALAEQPDVVLIELKDVSFIDSSGLGALVAVLKMTRSRGKKLFVCSANAQIKMLFELTSMDRVFESFESRQAFQEAVLATD
ncbi:STAS domain-containing protein [Geitlerinema sp. PCC 7407]|uniref:STAS domain-containing protein n=1 Tax=Geitlerinema sp. PCC 7407 TaxID=1173025 RepID=UPI00029FCC2C|nr:STAS domain-containing protein [Geitlerinema sp. PCC 7407]AFY68150.1 anti-sigma-factor antagonist [Geitlerinema sp. PCC 7407]